MSTLQRRPLREVVAPAALVLIAYGVLTYWLLYPVFEAPARTVVDPLAEGPAGWLVAPDINLIMWVISWGWHALTTEPASLFDANIFHPAPFALASSEHMLGHLPLFGPVYGLSGNPVLANQANLFLSIVLCASTMYALLRHWGVGPGAAFFAGFVYGFFPARVYNLGHAHLLAGQYLPLVLLFLDRTLMSASWRPAIALAAFLLLQMLCSYYLAYMTVVALCGYGLGVALFARGTLSLGAVSRAAVAVLGAGIVLGVLSIPYLRLEEAGVVPSYEGSRWLRTASSGLWQNYVYPPIAFREWGYRLDNGASLYVGLIPLALAGVALLPRWVHPRGRVPWAPTAALGLGLACYLMALGPDLELGGLDIPMPYKAALAFVPGFSAMRVPSRFGIMMMAGVAALAGLGLHRLTKRFPPAVGLGIAAALVLATAVEYDLLRHRQAVRDVRIGEDLPGVYRALASLPPGPLLEIPAGKSQGDFHSMVRESEYMLYSTFHWHRLLNGYSGYYPRSYDTVMSLARALPDSRALRLLQRTTGLRYVAVHVPGLTPAVRLRWNDPPGLRVIGRFEGALLFEVAADASADLLPDLIDPTPRRTTLLGTPLWPLAPEHRRTRIRPASPPPAHAPSGLIYAMEVEITNLSDATWPALAPVGDHRVEITFRWRDPSGRQLSEGISTTRLPYDLGPGESVRIGVHLLAPRIRGDAELVIGLAQDGEWFPDTTPPIEVRLNPVGGSGRSPSRAGNS